MADTPRVHVDDIIIRRAAQADASSIGDLWTKLVKYHTELDPRLPSATRHGAQLYARGIEGRLEDHYSRVLVAEHNGTVVGYVLGIISDMVPDMFQETTIGFLADIYVEEAYRQHGVGRKLVTALMDWFKSRGVAHMEWHVSAHNESGRLFWQSLGGTDIMYRMRLEL